MRQKRKTAFIITVICIVGVAGLAMLATALSFWGIDGQSYKAVKSEITEFFHDQGDVFMQPLEPTADDDVTIRIRVLRGNLRKATLRFTLDVDKNDVFSASKPDGAVYHDVEMHYERKDRTGYYDYWTGVIPKQSAPYSYHFLLKNDLESLYVNGPGSYSEKPFTTTAGDYFVMPGFTTPDWAKGALWYSIMPDSFFNGDITNDKYSSSGTVQTPWGQNHNGGNDYLGGDLKGIAAKVDYLKALNVDAVFINPVWLSVHQAGYGALDLKQIDSAFGNEDDLKYLVDTLHDAGIKVMMDGVFTYAHSSGNIYNGQHLFPTGAGAEANDENYEMFLYDSAGNLVTDWGMPMLDFSNPAVREYVYSRPDSVMQYYLDKFDIDGWRLDVGDSLKGSDPENWGTAKQIIKDMRGYVKQYGDDKLLVSEHADDALLKGYTIDSRWSHWPVAWPLINYIANTKAENVLLNDLTAGAVKIPRSIGNAQYTYTASHDFARTAYTAAGNENRLLAGNLLLMTYLGAPVIYYGDEIGMTGTPNPGVESGDIDGAAPSSFGPMNWDESTWQYRIFNQQKALGRLRKEYAGVFKDGAVVHLFSDIKQNLIAFGRFNDAGRTITVTNANSATAKNVRIEARRVGITNGTVLTDYMSGRKYTVKKGFVTVDVPSGGCVLVEGEAGNARGELWIEPLNGGRGEITSMPDGRLVLGGNSVFDAKRDTQNFAYKLSRNNCEIAATHISGSYFAAVRDSLNPSAAYYGITVKEGNATVYVRERKGARAVALTEFALAGNAKWKISRNSGSTFSVNVYDGNAWQTVSGSEKCIAMREQVYLGVSAHGGRGEISDVAVSRLKPQAHETFIGATSSMFSVLGNQSNIVVSDGKMRIQGISGGSFAVSTAPTGDFSVSARIASPKNEGDEVGLCAMSDEKNYVSVRVVKLGGKQYIQTGITIAGQNTGLEKIGYAAETVTLSLEKYGMIYRAKAISADGRTYAFTKGMNANYSFVRTGLFAMGKGIAEIDEFSYGDGISYNASQTFGYLDLSDRSVSLSINGLVASDKSKWKTVNGGYETVSAAYSAMSVSHGANPADGVFGDFKIDVTLEPILMLDDASYVGIRFSASAYDASDGYTIRLNRKGEIKLVREGIGGKILKTAAVKALDTPCKCRIVAVMEDGNLRVYVGNTPILKINTAIDYNGGYIGYVSDGAFLRILNRNEFSLTDGWVRSFGTLDIEREGEGEQAKTDITLLSNAQGYAYAGMPNQGVTDFVFGTAVGLQTTSFTKRGRFGILVGGEVGSTYKSGGILVGVDSSRRIFIEDKDGTLKSNSVSIDVSAFYFLVVVQEKKIRVYVDPYNEQPTPVSTVPVLEYDSEQVSGGALNLYGEFANTELTNVSLYGLKKGEDFTKVKPFTTRPVPEPYLPEPLIGEGEMEDGDYGFTSREDVALFYKYGGGRWKYDPEHGDSGMLTGKSYDGNWVMGATLAAGKTGEEYDLEYTMQVYGTTGIAGVVINKFAATNTHEESGIFLYTGNGAELIAYDGTTAGCGRGAVTNEDGWIHIKVSQRIVDNKHIVTVYDVSNNNAVVMQFAIEETNRPTVISGYVSLNVGNTSAGFKDIKYRKIQA